MSINVDLLEKLTNAAANFAKEAAQLNTVMIAALREKYGADGVVVVSIEFAAGRPRYILSVKTPDGIVTEVTELSGVSDVELEAIKKSLH